MGVDAGGRPDCSPTTGTACARRRGLSRCSHVCRDAGLRWHIVVDERPRGGIGPLTDCRPVFDRSQLAGAPKRVGAELVMCMVADRAQAECSSRCGHSIASDQRPAVHRRVRVRLSTQQPSDSRAPASAGSPATAAGGSTGSGLTARVDCSAYACALVTSTFLSGVADSVASE